MDNVSKQKRSWIMSRVKKRDTGPEKTVRSLLHSMGFRFRIQRKDLPGNPDIVLPKYKTIIFVHGCFWHRHMGCSKASLPKTNVDYWSKKFERNKIRDAQNLNILENNGWHVLVIWECELRDMTALKRRLLDHLDRSLA